MSNPLRGPAGPNQPPSLVPNQGKNPTDNRVASVANGVFSTDPGASPLPDSLSSRVSVGEVRLSKEDILKQWLESQPENAKAEAQQILAILQQKDLDNPFELDLRCLKNITSLPNVLQNCTRLDCSWCDSLQTLPELSNCKELDCSRCKSLHALPALPVCNNLDCFGCINLKALPELPNCRQLYCSECHNLETVPALPACIELNCYGCRSLRALPELSNCTKLVCTLCRSLRALPELSNCTYLDCSNCPNLEALLLRRDGFQVNYIYSPKVLLLEFVDSAKCEIEGVRYLPKALPEELKVLLTPPLPESASIDHLNSDLETFIKGLKESDLPTLKKESPGQEDLASYKRKLSEWKESLFSRVQGKLAYLGTPSTGTEELEKFYEKIEYYLLHLDAFLSIEENRDAFIERLQILQTQGACGARFIAELEQLFSLNCIGGETADLSNQFAQIASTEAKLAIERMFPDGDAHEINQAMFQLKDYLTGSYFKDQLSSEMHQGELICKFLKNHTSVNLVETIQNGLKPNSPLEELFTQYLEENFTPELSQEQLKAVIDDVDCIWKDTKERKIAAFETYDRIHKKKQKNVQLKKNSRWQLQS
jgi:hypothetical protein